MRQKTEFWEEAFQTKQEMWGMQPAHSALHTAERFARQGFKNILIPGVGYGRNIPPFQAVGMKVTGIEISQTAIDLARKHRGSDITIHHGPVADMPFDTHLYDGIFCYALIHLLDEQARKKLIADCHAQLTVGGIMVFASITKGAQTYGQGTPIGKDRFEMFGGVQMFFYDQETIQAEFGPYGLFEVTEVEENYPFYIIQCRKG